MMLLLHRRTEVFPPGPFTAPSRCCLQVPPPKPLLTSSHCTHRAPATTITPDNERFPDPMDLSTTPALRRSEDIALDLLKFVAAHTNLKPGSSGATPGFGVQSTPKSEDQVTQILDLYARCRQ